ncbi:hypothetical protein PHYPSEUDO_008751 [Phytophthora pseudosyringae]|uniref:Sugar transporter SWEET1 n=1 Tax=Phytophthora pseudosyringae TaxID=221518 RepID=A0A8T1VD96_9STRA|nr:hypothetical protein PHYPSEUDO_008751 [Phytophthora pseudosyringae]
MSAHETAVNVFRGLTIATTLMLRVSLLPDFRRMHKNHSTGEMSVMPCLLLFTNCYVVMFYALAIDNILPLLAVSILGTVTGVFFNYFFYRWADDKRFIVNAFVGSFIVCLLVTIYSILALAGHTGQSHASVGTTLGFITIGTTLGLYVSPMATIARVLRTKQASSMPFTMGVVNVFNSFCWGTYAALIGNMFILGPNIAGFILGCAQLVLTFIYRPKATASCEDGDDEEALAVLVLSPGDTGKKFVSSTGEKSPSFVAMSSPCHEEPKPQSEPRESPPKLKMNADLIVVKVFTIITTVMMRFSLVPAFVRMRKQRNTGDMSGMPPVILFTNCFTLSSYSYVIHDFVPLFVTETVSSMPLTMEVVQSWLDPALVVGRQLAPNNGGIILGTIPMVLTSIYSERMRGFYQHQLKTPTAKQKSLL